MKMGTLTDSASAAQPQRARRKVLIVDDHPILRRGLAAIVESEANLAVCGQAATYQEALKAIRDEQPEVVIVDLTLGDEDGLRLVKEIKARHPGIASLVLSMHDESVYAERCLKAGALGYVSKQQMDDTLLTALRSALEGKTYMSDALKERLAANYLNGRQPAMDSPLHVLSDRELQVFRLIGQGRSTREIAEALHLSFKTIETYREHIKQKLSLKSSAELAHRAARWAEAGPVS